jgi:hypothetical protein
MEADFGFRNRMIGQADGSRFTPSVRKSDGRSSNGNLKPPIPEAFRPFLSNKILYAVKAM